MTSTDSANGTNLRHQIYALAGVHVDGDILGEHFGKSGVLAADGVESDLDIVEGERAVIVGECFDRNTSGLILQFHRDRCQQRSGSIAGGARTAAKSNWAELGSKA